MSLIKIFESERKKRNQLRNHKVSEKLIEF